MNIVEVSALTFAIQCFVTLFVIMDPPGATPIFLALVSDKSPKERIRLAWQAAAISLVVIASFALRWVAPSLCFTPTINRTY